MKIFICPICGDREEVHSSVQSIVCSDCHKLMIKEKGDKRDEDR